jgi:hypothetical protein
MPTQANQPQLFKAKAYLKADCPYSFRFLLFMRDADLVDRMEIIRCDPQDAGYEQIKNKLQHATGSKATFPTVEIEPGVYKSDSKKLIEHYASRYNISCKSLPVFSFYEAGIFPQLDQLHGA